MAKNAPLSGDLHEELKISILQEDYPQGAKLTEQVICDKYGVSRTPVREAFKQLETEGLIEIIPNRGAFTTGFSKGDLRDLYTLREVYEVQAVRWAVERIYDDEFDALEESYEFMEFYTARKDTRRMKEINTNFHTIIYEAAHNRILAQVLNSFQVYMKHSIHVRPYEKEYLYEVFKEHKAIFDSFVKKNPNAAEKAMRAHIKNSMARTLKYPL